VARRTRTVDGCPGQWAALWPGACELQVGECHTAAVARLPGPSPLGGPPNSCEYHQVLETKPLQPVCCVLVVSRYQELDPNVVAGAVADLQPTPFKRAHTDWLFNLFIMPPSRTDRPGQSAHKALYPGNAIHASPLNPGH
jgi:hypothetical protein